VDGHDRYREAVTDWFWEVIARSNGDKARMRRILTEELTLDELCAFHDELEDAAADLLDEPFTDFMTKDSEDGARDVAYWMVSQGRAYYDDAFEHPEKTPETTHWLPDGVLHEGITLAVYWDRTGMDMPDLVREDD
jgi:hypothetical protein